MDRKLFETLKRKLIEINGGEFYTDLLIEPSEEQWYQLKNGSGAPDTELRQVNSSAGLAVNYWKIYESCHSIMPVEFEWKKYRPLARGRKANIDVVVRENDEINFFESKFLEPYYEDNEVPRDSYYDVTKYEKITKDSPASWAAFFKEASGFRYFNAVQLCRHLLAVCKDIWLFPESYDGKKVHLSSVIWDMTDSFVSHFPQALADTFRERREVLRSEMIDSEAFFNDFIAKHVCIEKLDYKVYTYNDIVTKLKESPLCKDFANKYFI